MRLKPLPLTDPAHLTTAQRFLLFALFVAVMSAFVILTVPGNSAAREIHVDDDAAPGGNGTAEDPFTQIQDAIDNATAGDVILIANGTYRENPVISISIELRGASRENTIIETNENDNGLHIFANDVVLSGISLHPDSNNTTEYAGIKLENEQNSSIIDCAATGYAYGLYGIQKINGSVYASAFTGNTIGIQFVFSSGIIISGNDCRNSTGTGIFLMYAPYSTIRLNLCTENGESGICVQNSDQCTIEHNICRKNGAAGIKVHSSMECTVERNTCINNTHGVILHFSNATVMRLNQCNLNTETGILLKFEKNDDLSMNIIHGNPVGIALVTSFGDTTINDNTISENGVGMDTSENGDRSIDATENYWGHDSGPYHALRNPTGTGDPIVDSPDTADLLSFIPWEDGNGNDVYGTENTGQDDDDDETGLNTVLVCALLLLFGSLFAVLFIVIRFDNAESPYAYGSVEKVQNAQKDPKNQKDPKDQSISSSE